MASNVKQTAPQCLAKNAGTGACSPTMYGRFCGKHRKQYQLCIIDRNGSKLRDPNKNLFPQLYDGCIMKDKNFGTCSHYRGGRFCVKHNSNYTLGMIDWDGNILRKRQRGIYKRCIAKNAGTGECSRYEHGKFCGKHRYQYYHGIIDAWGKKLKDPILGSPKKFTDGCIAKNAGTGECSKYYHGRFCRLHSSQYMRGRINENGIQIVGWKSTRKKFSECLAKNAGTGSCTFHKNGRFCNRHMAQYKDGIIDVNGRRIRLLLQGSDPTFREKCHIEGCKGLAGPLSGYCLLHYKEIIEREKFEKYPSIIPVSKHALIKEEVVWHGWI